MRQNNKRIARLMMDEIQRKRERMIDSAEKYGYTSDDTIKCSEELDELIYKYQCTFQKRHHEEEVKVIFQKMVMIYEKPIHHMKVTS
ncbi:aspartyl-phosphate phosphatase Spo0E family protein [Bacillus aquiflavi]|nr:aspartyl-phosphate phosphatase Spo0E family protein [Bacillus aquiflavi]